MNFVADLWLRLRRARRLRAFPPPRPFRYERFGGIAQLGGRTALGQALVFVDRDRARALGYTQPPAGLWDDHADSAAPTRDGDDAWLSAPLSAPLEAHLQLTNRCDAGCSGCYTGATAAGAPHEWGLADWCRALDELAAAGVFHVALGGGESATLPWLGDLLMHARQRGIVPNLTTSGLYSDEVLARLCDWTQQGLFGQINVSIDGVGDRYARVRGFDGFARADRALAALRRYSPDVGINCVLSRDTFDDLDRLFAHARHRRASEIEILRFKPAGRGARDAIYDQNRCTDAQHRALLPTVLQLSRRHRTRVRLDCSFTPMVVHHRPPPRLVQFLCIYGCAAGDLLVGAKSGGQMSGCSFFPSTPARVDALREYRGRPDAFPPFRAYVQNPPPPCADCEYRALCRGGCRAVAVHVTGDGAQPDPECPRVIDHRAAHPPSDGDDAAMTQCAKKRLPVLA